MVRAPAANVKAMSFVSLMLVAPTADIAAFPFQVPANAAGIVAPVVRGEVDVVCGVAAAGLLVLPASELAPEPCGEEGGDPRVRRTTARTMSAAAAAPQAARIGVRRDRAAARPGIETPVGWLPGNVGPAGGYCGPVCGYCGPVYGTESARPSGGAIGPAAPP